MKVVYFLFCVLVPGIVAFAATVHLNDGTVSTGTVRVTHDGIIIQQEGSADRKLSLDQIQEMDLRERVPATTQNTSGVGALKAEFFLGTDFQPSRRQVLRADFRINGRWDGADNPFRTDAVRWVQFCVRWTGRIEPLYSEKYWFHVRPQDYTRVWIDHHLIVDDQAELNLPINLEAGKKYEIRVDQVAMNRSYTLMWESQSQPYSLVPSSCLSIPVNDPDPAVVTHFIAPIDGAMLTAHSDLPILIQVDDAGRHIKQVQLYEENILLQSKDAAPYQFTWRNVPGGEHVLQARALDESGNVWSSVPIRLDSVENNQGKLLVPWGQFDVGSATTIGRASNAGESITLNRPGGELLLGNDNFLFVLQPQMGNCQITAHLSDVRLDQPAANSRSPAAGLMIRSSLSANSAHAAVLFSPDTGSIFLTRKQTDAPAISMATTAKSAAFLRLVREGKRVSGYRSSDGTTWEFLGSEEIDLTANALVGLVLSSENDHSSAAAMFDHLTVKATDPDEEKTTVSGLRLVDGTLLNGWFRGFDRGSITLEMLGLDRRPRITIPADQISRAIYRPIKAESLQGLRPQDQGVVLKNGDVLQGQITRFEGETVEVGSDVFGPRNFRARDVLSAILFRQASNIPAKYQLTLRDGSTIQATSIVLEDGGVTVDCSSIKRMHFAAPQLAKLEQHAR